MTRAVPYLGAPVPAVFLGAVLMEREGLGTGLWAQQIGAAVLGTLICAVLVTARPRPASTRAWVVAAVAAALFVAATLAFSGVEGVRRWIPVGPLQLNASALALPVLILALGGVDRTDGARVRRWVWGAALVAAVALVVQPDASQATALAAASAVLLLLGSRASAASRLVAAAVVVLAAVSWTRADPLLPVPHVEGIVGVAERSGGLWHAAAVIALGLLPLPFVAAAIRGTADRGAAVALAVYFGIACIAPGFGAYPVPVMGFGLSYVFGYYAALGWLAVAAASAQNGDTSAMRAR